MCLRQRGRLWKVLGKQGISKMSIRLQEREWLAEEVSSEEGGPPRPRESRGHMQESVKITAGTEETRSHWQAASGCVMEEGPEMA